MGEQFGSGLTIKQKSDLRYFLANTVTEFSQLDFYQNKLFKTKNIPFYLKNNKPILIVIKMNVT